MRARIRYIEEALRDSYWFTPAMLTLAAVVLSFLTSSVDENFDPEKVPGLNPLLYSGGPDGAREVLGVIAGSMIGLAGVVFSITIVALTLASSQFGPRLLANFMRDRGNQVTLGTFVATFLYSLLILREISADGKVPHLSVSCALLLAAAGLAVLIYFIHHIAMGIQAPTLVASVGAEIRVCAEALFPDTSDLERARPGDGPLPGEGEPVRIGARQPGYVEMVDLDGLVGLAARHDLTVALDCRPGLFLVRESTLLRVWPPARVTDEIRDDLADTVSTGARRTPMQDIEFPIQQLAEIAVRALSPSINDPYTASSCVDQLSAGMCKLARREFPSRFLADESGTRIEITEPVTFDALVRAAFSQIRQSASFHAPVYDALLLALTRVAGNVVVAGRLPPLLDEARLVLKRAEEAVDIEADLEATRERFDAVIAAAEARHAELR